MFREQGAPRWPAAVGLLAIPVVGLADYYAGFEITFLLFYLPSAALVGWAGGSRLGIVAAAAAAVGWLLSDIHNRPSSHTNIAFLNAGCRFLVFVSFALLFAVLRQHRDRRERTVREITLQLQNEINERARIQREVAETSARQQRRVAYDLHDGVGQHLSGVAFKSKLLEQKLRNQGSPEADEAASITRLINDALRQTRMVARSMESTYGEARGLKEALQKLAQELRDHTQVSTVVDIDDVCEAVPAPADIQLLYIAKEAAHNATAHGQARNIEIGLHSTGGEIVLTIRDDGCGFDRVPRSGMGMRTMHYRAETIGGSLIIDSKAGAGTTVSCRIPNTAGGNGEVAVKTIS